jgi:hypothetical protein
MAKAGKKTLVYVSTDDVTYNLVDDIRSVNKEDVAEELDTTKFGDVRRTSVPGFPGGNITMEGYWNVPNDPLGQQVLRDAKRNETEVWVKILWDGVNGERTRVRVGTFSKGSAVDTVNGLSIVLLPQAGDVDTP